MTRLLLCFSILLLQSFKVESASIIYGKVSGTDGTPLSFASVYVNGTTRGTTTNVEGNYSIELLESDRQLVFRSIGYKTRVVELAANRSDKTELNVLMETESYSLGQIQIRADAEDPAYAIIRKAIANRKKNGNVTKTYACTAYVKGLQRLTKYPKKFLGQDVRLDEFIDTVSGIVYLSESVSKLEFQKPDLKETMISSKVSGNSRGFSFNQASEMDVDIYQNIINIADLSPRGFISPISPGALVYYRYRFDGSFLEDGVWVNKIEVIPKRKADPVFSGYVYIQDESWRVHAFDLLLTKEAQIQFIDSLRVNQIYIPASADGKTWMPGSITYTFAFGVLGFFGKRPVVATYSGYVMDPSYGKKHFGGEVLKIEKGSNEKDTAYWNDIRPVPLTVEEARDYVVRDSTQKTKESKTYLDSLDRVSNKFKFSNILTGYSYLNRYRKIRYVFPGLLENIQYNTVEGTTVAVSVNVAKNPADNKDSDADIALRYGTASEKINVAVTYRKVFRPRLFGAWNVAGGDDLVQFNGATPITPINNTSYTLLDGHNYMKLYRKQFMRAGIRMEPLNGLRFTIGAEYAIRSAVKNNSFVSWASSGTKSFNINNPPFTGIQDKGFASTSALLLHGGVRIRFKQKYVDRPDVKYLIGSKFPFVNVQYHVAIPRGGVLDADYSILKLAVEDRMSLGMAGTFSYQLMAGKFLHVNQAGFMDLVHFNGNKTIFSEFKPERFDLLEYYSYSTNDGYFAAYLEHAMGGLLLNKIPGVRKLKLNEVLGARFLDVPGKPLYAEISLGIEKLGVFRADLVLAMDEDGNRKSGFVIGIKRNFGR